MAYKRLAARLERVRAQANLIASMDTKQGMLLQSMQVLLLGSKNLNERLKMLHLYYRTEAALVAEEQKRSPNLFELQAAEEKGFAQLLQNITARIGTETALIPEELENTLPLAALLDFEAFIQRHPKIQDSIEWTEPAWLFTALVTALRGSTFYGGYNPFKDHILVSPLVALPSPAYIVKELALGKWPEVFVTLHHELAHALQFPKNLPALARVTRRLQNFLWAGPAALFAAAAAALWAPTVTVSVAILGSAALVFLIGLISLSYPFYQHQELWKQWHRREKNDVRLLNEAHAHVASAYFDLQTMDITQNIHQKLQTVYGMQRQGDSQKISSALTDITRLRSLGVSHRHIGDRIALSRWNGSHFDNLHEELTDLARQHHITETELMLLAMTATVDRYADLLKVIQITHAEIEKAFQAMPKVSAKKLLRQLADFNPQYHRFLNYHWHQKAFILLYFGIMHLSMYIATVRHHLYRNPG
jgi:hypothetical protein